MVFVLPLLPVSSGLAQHLPAGGLAGAAVHELRAVPGSAAHLQFAVLLLAGLKRPAPVLWVGAAPAAYAPGLAWLGLDPRHCIFAKARDETESLGILEVTLRGGMAGVAEVADLPRLAARRLALAAKHGGTIGFLLRPAPAFTPKDSTAPATRWLITALPAEAPERPRLQAELLYARGGRPGAFVFEIVKEAEDAATPPALALLTGGRGAARPAFRRAG